MNVIRLCADIDNDSYKEFSIKLTRANSEKTNEPITLIIMSDGGSSTAALAFFDLIKSSRRPVITYATGLVASAATLIFAAGAERLISPNAWLMVHEDQVGSLKGLEVHQIEKKVAVARRLEDQWNTLLESVTGTPAEIWLNLNQNETYLDAATALEYGIATEIWK